MILGAQQSEIVMFIDKIKKGLKIGKKKRAISGLGSMQIKNFR